jgi:hypothetical protein
MRSLDKNLKEKIFAGLILIALLVIYFQSVVIGGNSFLTTLERTYRLGQYHYSGTYWHVARERVGIDPAAAVQINLPSAYLESHYLRNLRLPLWNPYSGLGRPYNADMNSYAFFLPIYPFKLFPSLLMYDLFLLMRLFISGFFLFLLLRLYRCSFLVSTAGASFYMFNSYFFTFIDMDHINVTMFLPLLAYFLTKFRFSRNRRYLIGFIFCSAGSFYGGNPNEFILIHIFATAYFVFLMFLKKNSGIKTKIYLSLTYLIALGFSILLSSLKLIPFLEFWRNSLSSRMAGITGMSESLSVKKFLAWILTPHQMFEGPNYVGYLILSLVLYALFNLVRKKWGLREKIVGFHFVLLALVISKINAAPYIHWIGTLPLLKNINYVKYSSLIYYLISVLSAFSLVYLIEDVKDSHRNLRLLGFLLCCALPHLILWSVFQESFFQMTDKSDIFIHVFLVFTAAGAFLIVSKPKGENRAMASGAVIVMMLLAIIELRLNNQQNYRERFEIDDKAPYTQYLLDQKQPFRAMGIGGTLMPNCNLIFPIPTTNRVFALRVKRSTELLSRIISPKFNSGMGQVYLREEIWGNPYLEMLNTRYYVSESVLEGTVINPGYARAHKIDALIDNPVMHYTRRGDLYSYRHRGWEQLADSSIDIPMRLPPGKVFLKSTAVAFNFEWRKRESPANTLILTISVKQGGRREIVYKRELIAHRKEDQDFFNLKIDLSKYSGHEVVLNFDLRNPGAKVRNDRAIFYGDLRVTYHKIKKTRPSGISQEESLNSDLLETAPYEEVFSHHAIVYRNNNALERGFVLYDVIQTESVGDVIEILREDPLIYKKVALIEGEFPSNMKLGRKGHSRVTFAAYQPHFIKIDVETTENGVFILSDAYYPGWKAYLDKREVEIHPAFYGLRGVFLPQGKHDLIFRYQPWTFLAGSLLTMLSLVFLVLAFIKKNRRASRFNSF